MIQLSYPKVTCYAVLLWVPHCFVDTYDRPFQATFVRLLLITVELFSLEIQLYMDIIIL